MKGVACTIYKLRPSGCRKVEAGDEECLIARRRFGLPLTRAGDLERIAAMADMQSGAIVIDVDGTFSIRVHPAALPLDEAE